jgi:hypothetical protein
MNNDVDVNILIQTYHNKISTLYNQNILLEVKIQTLTQDYAKEMEVLILKNLELQKELDNSNKTIGNNTRLQTKFTDAEVE